jgi:hypothetical protein
VDKGRLITLAIVVVIGFLFSAAGVFLGAAAFGSMMLVALVRRRWRQLAEPAVVGAAAGTLLIFVVLYQPGLLAALNYYWKAYLPVDQGWAAISDYMARGGLQMASVLGMGRLVAALLPAAGGCHAGRAPPNARRTRRTRPAGGDRRAGRALCSTRCSTCTLPLLLTALAITAAIGVTVCAPWSPA